MSFLGVKFNRDYNEIVEDLVPALASISDCYTFLDMDEAQWNALCEDEKNACIRTLADDLFYGLGTTRSIEVGSGVLEYDQTKHLIKIHANRSVVHVINLI